MSETATKAVVTLLTGLNTWAAVYLDARWAGLLGVVVAAGLCWLVPNRKVTADG